MSNSYNVAVLRYMSAATGAGRRAILPVRASRSSSSAMATSNSLTGSPPFEAAGRLRRMSGLPPKVGRVAGSYKAVREGRGLVQRDEVNSLLDGICHLVLTNLGGLPARVAGADLVARRKAEAVVCGEPPLDQQS